MTQQLTELPSNTAKRLTLGWLYLGLAALIIGGLYSILLVASRTPGIHKIIPWIDLFHTALVIHVDMTVLIWFLAFTAVIWSYTSIVRYRSLDWLALGLAGLGSAIIAISPFTGETNPLINNYVPVLEQTAFLLGLGIFGAGFLLRTVTRVMEIPAFTGPHLNSLDCAGYFAAIATAISLIALILSIFLIPESIEGVLYYELLFWGSGHGIQITHSILVLAAWTWLLVETTQTGFKSGHLVILFAIAALPMLGVLPIYYLADQNSSEFRHLFTQLMRYGGLFTLPLSLLIVANLFKTQELDTQQRVFRAALLSSLLLFLMGGVLGFMIEGINVVIPAHYHGSIVGVTLAYMGITYLLLPKLGFRLTLPVLARRQLWISAWGQIIHISALAWSGGYGVQRKTAGAAQGLERIEEIISMGMMGMGGLIAIIGGILFLVVALHALLKGRD